VILSADSDLDQVREALQAGVRGWLRSDSRSPSKRLPRRDRRPAGHQPDGQ
jgi:DNA-binding NarL/FixJ family response regulator